MSFRRRLTFNRSQKPSKLYDLPLDDILENPTKIDDLPDESIKKQYRQSLQIKDGANKIYALSKNKYQKLDAAKASMVADLNVRNLNNLCQSNGYSFSNSQKNNFMNKAQITISGIRIPLLWNDNQGNLVANGRYAIFCLFICNDEIRESQLICDIEPGILDISFYDVIQFKNVKLGSECIIELYGHALTKSNLNLRKKRLMRTCSFDEEIKPNDGKTKLKTIFERLGRVTIQLTDRNTSHSRNSDTLCVTSSIFGINRESECDIPFFETLACELSLIPMSRVTCLLRGEAYIQIFKPDSSELSFESGEYYCELKDQCLHGWRLSESIRGQINRTPFVDRNDFETADLIVPVTKHSLIEEDVLESDLESKLLKLTSYFDSQKNHREDYIITTKDSQWFQIITDHIQEQVEWSHLFEVQLSEELPEPTSFLRNGSVYKVV